VAEPNRNLVLDVGGPVAEGASFGSVVELVAHIDSYNDGAHPFVWTKSAVHQKRLKPCFAV
jgi:hypothetical protein